VNTACNHLKSLQKSGLEIELREFEFFRVDNIDLNRPEFAEGFRLSQPA
jgi:hypothetical protein